ncbi:hypothetical protein BJY21_001497 [Kineosphaera limosa]|uniref:DinB-like domain-containing protein n=1 Tax=Kineosphaera limosa NBRC 100340 TaxID=1184609 RepID=K6WTC8_9MICO|nr:DUF664 domain-containing protein [Kineosphaera limosa]NYE00313.1 hypothetical protein [Kineosphaera limosa]GAB97111.1 hypothetical protein KILIM_057_00020 [Kineosphaera limosa NBRC 100340]
MSLTVTPAVRSEIDELTSYVEQQLRAIRTSAYGLTDEQARVTPCASALSIGGIVKHCAYVADGWRRRRTQEPGPVDPQAFAETAQAFMASFALTDQESITDALADFDAAAERLLCDLRALDPDAEVLEPPAPWDGRFEPTPTRARYAILHEIEEFARHAGHADIIREQLDGADAGGLDLAVTGRPGNDFIRPWTPEPKA